MYLVLFENTPFFTALELASLLVIPSLDGIAHGRHFGWLWWLVLLTITFLLLVRSIIAKV